MGTESGPGGAWRDELARGNTERVLALLRTTDDAAERNAIALALTDAKVAEAFDPIVALLRDERTRTNRGTLLHALRGYDCAPILPLLVDHVIDGGYEVRKEAFELAIDIDADLDPAVWQACVDRLRAALPGVDEDRRWMLAELLAMFEPDDPVA